MTKFGFFYNINMQHFASLKESLKEFRPTNMKPILPETILCFGNNKNEKV